ncbi:hypothetical protein CASFOL_012256 [Castilleja foliolosa]|uniref:Ubiquitin-like protease family profile domain-containing protein n=1 Tax=Castilleja foliolosa TaxID=1961234 RepID=A0ABD3DR24_9LAMI
MASLQEEHLNRLRYEATTGGKRPAQPSIPAHVEVEEQPKKRGRMTIRKARAAPPTRRTSVSTSGPLCEEPVKVEAGKKKGRKGARKAQANPPARQTSTSTAAMSLLRDPQQGDTGSTTSTGFLMLEPPQTQMPESTSVPEWTKFKLLGTIKEQLSKVNALERFENSVFGHFSSDHLPSENGVYRRHFDEAVKLWAYETIPMFAEEGGMKSGDSGIPRGVRWKCPKNNWNWVHELDRDDVTCDHSHDFDGGGNGGAVHARNRDENFRRGPHNVAGEGSGERVGTAHGVGTSGDVGSRGAVGDRATDDPSPSVLESMNRAVSSAVSHALPGALRETLELTLPVLLPDIVERAIELVLPGMLSDAVCRAVDLAIPGAVEQAVELFRRLLDKAFPDVSCSRDERGYQGVHGNKEPTENVGNVRLVTPKEPRLKRLKLKSRLKLSPFVDCLDNDRRKSLKEKFAKWRRQVNAKERDVGINPKYIVGPEYFVEIEKARTHLSTTSDIRLRPGVSLETLNIRDSSFYGHLVKAWNTLHPPDVECAPVDYAQWDVPTILFEYVEGSLPRWGQPWTTVSNVVLVCNVEQHWVVCLLRIDAWEITLFDSLPSPDRVRQLEPLSRLIPYVIAKGDYFDAKSVAPRFDLMQSYSFQRMTS